MPRSTPPDKQPDVMRAVQRIVAVFESFTPQKSSLSLQELSERIALPKSTTFRIAQSLEKAGYLVRLEDQQYCLSFRFTRLAGLVRSTLDIRVIARPIMTELAEETRETISLQMTDGRQRICLDAVATESPLRSITQPGEALPLLAGASSKLLVAHMPAKEMAATAARIAKASKRTPAEVQVELEQIRRQGYAVSHGERVLGVSAVAAPILGTDDSVRYCLALNGPTVRVQGNEKAFITQVIAATANISRRYGGAAPPAQEDAA